MQKRAVLVFLACICLGLVLVSYADSPPIVVEYKPDQLILEKDVDAEEYVKQTVTQMLADKLVAIGFFKEHITPTMRRAKITKLDVNGREVYVQIAGKKERRMLYRPTAVIQVFLTQGDLDTWFRDMRSTVPKTYAECEDLFNKILFFAKLGGPRQQLSELDSLLLPQWANTTKVAMGEKMQNASPTQPDYIKKLKDAWNYVQRLLAAYPQAKETEDLLNSYQYFVMQYVDTYDGTSSNAQVILNSLSEIEGVTEGRAQRFIQVARNKIAAKWLQTVRAILADRSSTDSVKLREEYEQLLATFPDNPEVKSFQNEYRQEMARRIQEMKISTLSEMVAFTARYVEFQTKFPQSEEKKMLLLLLAKACENLMPTFKIENQNDLEQFSDALSICRSAISDQKLVEKLTNYQQEKERIFAEKAGEERVKKSLGETSFLVNWDKGLKLIQWGRSKDNFYVKKEMRDLWQAGENADNCQCLIGTDEEVCRRFKGEEGGYFDVVTRFYENRIYQIELCGIYAEGGERMLNNFISSRYKMKSTAEEARNFFTDSAGSIILEEGIEFMDTERGVTIKIKAPGHHARLIYTSNAELKRKENREAALERKSQAEEERAKQERLKKGFNEGDCVMWECSPVCKYRGTVRQVKGTQLRIGITSAEDSPAEVGRAVWRSFNDVMDCD